MGRLSYTPIPGWITRSQTWSHVHLWRQGPRTPTKSHGPDGEEEVSSRKLGAITPAGKKPEMDTDPIFSWKTLALPSMLCDLRPTAFPLWSSCASSRKDWAGGCLNSNIPEFWDSFQDWRLLLKSQERSSTSGDGGGASARAPSLAPVAWEACLEDDNWAPFSRNSSLGGLAKENKPKNWALKVKHI